MIENKNLPVPMKYCKQVIMEFYFYNEKLGKAEKKYYFPELGSWISRPKILKDRLKYRNLSINTWRTKWYLGMSESQMGTIEWAVKFIETIYPDKLPYSKYEILLKLLEDSDYECDFTYTKKDLISLYYKTRKENNLPIVKYDWSLVQDRFCRFNESFTIISLAINKKTGNPIGERITNYDYLIREMRDYDKTPLNIVNKKENQKNTFFKKAKKIHGDKYDYSESEYINSSTKIKIKCNTCGNIFYQSPAFHLLGHGCPVCGNEKEYNVVDWDKELDNLKNYLASGKKYEEIGRIYGCSGHQVGVISRKYGIDTIKTELETKQWEEERKEFIGYLESGMNETEISKKLNLSVSFISSKLKTLKINFEDYFHPRYIDFLDKSDEIRNLLLKGENIKSISRILGTTRDVIDRVILEKIDMESINNQRNKILLDKITKLVDKGYNISTMSEILNISTCSLSKFIKENNIKVKASISKGEYYVSVFLENKIELFTEVNMHNRHDDVISSLIFVDFELVDKNNKRIIIEYNGDQHYRFVKKFHRTKNRFLRRLHRDEMLRKYCSENNIYYIEIPFMYNTQDKVNEFLEKTLIQGIDQNTLVDYKSLYKLPD